MTPKARRRRRRERCCKASRNSTLSNTRGDRESSIASRESLHREDGGTLSPKAYADFLPAVAFGDFFFAAFFVAFFAAFFAAFFFAMIQTLLQEINLGGPSLTAGWRTGLSVSVSTNLSTESIPACQPWQTVCQFRPLDSLLVGCRGSDQFHEHLTINIKHEPTLNTPTSYRFQKILQDNCAGFGHFLQKFFQIENRATSPSRAVQHHRAARAADEITMHDSKQRPRKTIVFQLENTMFSGSVPLRMHRAQSLMLQRLRGDQAQFDDRSTR